jgi:phosphatidylglycerol lysyltransferase
MAAVESTSSAEKSRPLPPTKLAHRPPTYWAQSFAPSAENDQVPRAVRLDLLRRFGSFSLAYSIAFQPHLQYFGDDRGFLAYRQRGGITFVLGDPICSPERRRDLLQEFLLVHQRPSFVQIGRETADILSRLGFSINEMGIDSRIDLRSYSFAGQDKEWLRYADNWVSKRHYRIDEGDIRQYEAEIVAVSEAWRSTRTIKRKEVRFLSRPIVMEDEVDTRRFFLFDDQGRMLAFVFFDPIYSEQRVVGYVTCFKRRVPDATPYAEPAIMKRAIETFQREGREHVLLGLSPLANIEDPEFRCNRLLHWSLKYYFRAGWLNRRFYNLEGHSQYKARFRGNEEKVYYATPAWFNTYRLLALTSLCGIF